MSAAGDGPLAGRRVLVTRAVSAGTELSDRLRALGAEPLEVPLFRIEKADMAPLIQALADPPAFDWIVVTSPNGADALAAALGADNHAAGDLPPVASVGPGTSARLGAHGVAAALEPREHHGRGLADALAAAGPLRGKRFLLVRPERAPRDLPQALAAAGAKVTEVAAYRTVIAGPEAAGALEAALAAGVAAIAVTSPSTVEAWVRALGADRTQRVFTEVPAVAIGPSTGAAMKRHGLPIAAIAHPHTMEALATAISVVSASNQ